MRKVFLDELPIKIYKNKKCIDWLSCIGYKTKFIYDDIEGEIEIVDYKGGYLYLKYLNNPIYKMWTSTFTSGRIKVALRVKTGEFKINIGQIFKDEKRDLIIIDRKIIKDKSNITRKWYKYKCNICGFSCEKHYNTRDKEHKEDLWISESDLLGGKGCSCCHGVIVVEGINDIPTLSPSIVYFFPNGYQEAKLYTCNSGQKINPICPDCGKIGNKISIAQLNRDKSITCTCSDKISYPNKLAYSLLDQLNEIYQFDCLEREYSPEWIGRKLYDNYFIYNERKYIVEMDGGFHSTDNLMNGQTKETSKEIDDYKDKLAKEHDIEVIRIDCYYKSKDRLEYVKQNIIDSKLNEIFDLSIIDWLKCEEFALSNFVKTVCHYKKENPNSTTKTLSINFKIATTTIRRYLKIGNNLNWCHYDAKAERKEAQQKAGKSNGKLVEIFKDGVSLGLFPSATELEIQSEKLFGIKLIASALSMVCNGKRKHHKGFTFTYSENNLERSC